MRRKDIDIWHHDQNVSGFQSGVFIKPGQQLVLKDFHFALFAMCLVKAQAIKLIRVVSM